jgi:hypothetical protein
MANQNVTIPNPLNAGDTLTVTVGPSDPTITGVTVSGPGTLAEGATAQFNAKVTGTGSFSSAVTWSASAGTISQTGLLTAPSAIETVTVTATSVEDTTKFGSQPVAVSSPSNTVKISPSGGDDTAALQAALNSTASAKQILEMTVGTWHLSPINMPSGANLLIDPGTLITDNTGYAITACMFNFNSSNVIVTATGAFAQMPNSFAQTTKEAAAGEDSQYRHCITVGQSAAASSVSVTGLSISEAGGDGVNFVHGSGLTFSNVTTTGCFRQGWSVTGGISNLTVNGGGAVNNLNTGYDFEPDSPGDSVTGVVLNDFATSGNKGGGISFGFFNLAGTDKVGVIVNNPTSTKEGGTGIGFTNKNSGVGANPSGSVVVNGAIISSPQNGACFGSKSTDGWSMVFNNTTVTNPNTGGPDRYGNNSAIGVRISGGETGTVGGVQWNNITITGGTSATNIPSSAKQVTVKGTWNGAAINISQ